jgi:hypothetical protein
MRTRNRESYSGVVVGLVWLAAICFGITFWAGVACLAGRVFQ